MKKIFSRKNKSVKFIFTSLDELGAAVEKDKDRHSQFVIGLKNDDFKIGMAHVSTGVSDEELENSVEAQISILIPGYDSMDYITKLITESQNETEESFLTITIEREKIEEIVQICKNLKIELIGIYPSFLLDEQKNLEDIVTMIPTITVEEGTVEEGEILLEGHDVTENENREKTNLSFMQHGIPLNLRQSIKLDMDRLSFNFLGEEYRADFIKDKTGKIILLITLILIFLQFGGYLYLKEKIKITNQELAMITQSNQAKEGHIKELDGKIAAVPDLKNKLGKLEGIVDNKDSKINEILYIVKKSSVNGLFIDNLKIDKNMIVMNGTTETTEALYEFQRKLLAEGLFEIVMSPVVTNGTFYSFEIDAKIK